MEIYYLEVYDNYRLYNIYILSKRGCTFQQWCRNEDHRTEISLKTLFSADGYSWNRILQFHRNIKTLQDL